MVTKVHHQRVRAQEIKVGDRIQFDGKEYTVTAKYRHKSGDRLISVGFRDTIRVRADYYVTRLITRSAVKAAKV